MRRRLTKLIRRAHVVVCIAVLFIGLAPSAVADPPSASGEMLEIAQLNDIFFLDVDRGWAVGDRGVIWRTEDGGRHWQLGDSPATCRLESIHFANETHGWIVGGWTHPFTHRSSALILHTNNGGRRWTRIEVPSLPALKWVSFADPKYGMAVGDASAMYPTGVFQTEDGGRGWNSFPSADNRSFTIATLSETNRLLAVDRESLVWQMTGRQLEPVAKPEVGLRRLQATASDGAHGWIVGDGGAVMCSKDGGQSWKPADRTPTNFVRHFDWHTVAVRGKKCWIAGSPGSCVLHSADGGTTWQSFPTGHSLPIRKLWFLDEHHGWAVGDFGTILATHDGGQTWRVQRRGATRTAIASIVSASTELPWELLAKYAADEGYCTMVQTMTHSREIPEYSSLPADRLHEAAVSIGAGSGEAAWGFPFEESDSVKPLKATLDKWDRELQARSSEQIEELLVRQLRLYRPDVVITGPITSDGSRPVSNLIGQLVIRAAQRSGDPTAFPDQLLETKLEPWTVKKVFSVLPPDQRGSLTVDNDLLAIHLGSSLADYSALARGLAEPNRGLATKTTSLRLLHSTTTAESAARELFSGITPGVIGECRRPAVHRTNVNMDSLARVLEKQRALSQFAEKRLDSNSVELINHLNQLTQGLSPHIAGVMLHGVANQLAAQAQFDAAATMDAALVQRYPGHMFTESTLAWLLKYYASEEWQRGFGHQSPAILETADTQVRPLPAIDQEEPLNSAFDVQLAGVIQPVQPAKASQANALERAVGWANLIQQVAPPMFNDPSIQFSLAAAQRRLNHYSEATRLVQVMANANLPLVWRSRARGEYWLLEGNTRSPRPTVDAAYVQSKPYLDGVLDDEIWRHGPHIELMPPTADEPQTIVKFARDAEFFYIAAISLKNASVEYVVPNGPRQRDTDLTKSDRLEFLFDVDRDYASCYRLAIDHRGWTVDSVDAERRWNPRWYLATGMSETDWTIEAAIPLAELSSIAETGRAAWAVGVTRTLPNGDSICWPPGAGDRSQVDGYLLFPKPEIDSQD